MAPSEPIIVYLYPFSPYGRKITEYLTLRAIPHTEVHEAAVPPRENILALGVQYRRIPVVAIGRDIYCDTKLILEKLETLYPGSHEHPALGQSGPHKALEGLLETWTSDIVFQKACWIIPPDMPAMADAAFTKDRSELWGGDWGIERQKALRPQGLLYIQENLDYLEELVEDGRKFATGDHPRLADIHALWVFHWLQELLPGAIPEDYAQKYPKAFAWIGRYADALKAGKASLPETKVIDGADAIDKVLGAGFAENDDKVDADDVVAKSLGLKEGTKVEVYPEDIISGYKHRDTGSLAVLNRREVAVKTKAKDRDVEVRIHAPRWNYKIQLAGATNGA